jgi:Antitoxin VbhA
MEPRTSEERSARIMRVIRLNQSEGLEPTRRFLDLAQRYIAEEISLEEFRETVLGWK